MESILGSACYGNYFPGSKRFKAPGLSIYVGEGA